MDKKTFDELYHSDKPFSFGSKKRVKDNLKSTKEEIASNLRKNDIYTRYKQYKNVLSRVVSGAKKMYFINYFNEMESRRNM